MQLVAASHPSGSDEDARHTAQLAQSRDAQWIDRTIIHQNRAIVFPD